VAKGIQGSTNLKTSLIHWAVLLSNKVTKFESFRHGLASKVTMWYHTVDLRALKRTTEDKVRERDNRRQTADELWLRWQNYWRAVRCVVGWDRLKGLEGEVQEWWTNDERTTKTREKCIGWMVCRWTVPVWKLFKDHSRFHIPTQLDEPYWAILVALVLPVVLTVHEG